MQPWSGQVDFFKNPQGAYEQYYNNPVQPASWIIQCRPGALRIRINSADWPANLGLAAFSQAAIACLLWRATPCMAHKSLGFTARVRGESALASVDALIRDWTSRLFCQANACSRTRRRLHGRSAFARLRSLSMCPRGERHVQACICEPSRLCFVGCSGILRLGQVPISKEYAAAERRLAGAPAANYS
jgi:hypothetical protein